MSPSTMSLLPNRPSLCWAPGRDWRRTWCSTCGNRWEGGGRREEGYLGLLEGG